jgi:hypothetical protein
MPRILIIITITLLLASCGGAPAVTAAQVAEKLTAAGATNIHDDPIGADVPVPKSFTAHQAFEIPSVAPRGGQFFVCDTKQNCDAIYAYYDALKALAGPYTYQSPSGTVVAQLNSGLTPDEAAKFEAAIKSFP